MAGLFLAGSGAWGDAHATLYAIGPYYIINANSAKCLDVEYASLAAGAGIKQYHCHGGANQIWRLSVPFESTPQRFGIHNANSNMCLDIPSSSTANRVGLQQFPCHGGNNQLFSLESVWSGSWVMRLRVSHSGKCLDVPNGSHANVQVQQYTCHTKPNQEWLLVPAF
jgi:hypothetical protein